ncbi:hypothetical protein V1477_007290, partial [Vespula maculifrons]
QSVITITTSQNTLGLTNSEGNGAKVESRGMQNRVDGCNGAAVTSPRTHGCPTCNCIGMELRLLMMEAPYPYLMRVVFRVSGYGGGSSVSGGVTTATAVITNGHTFSCS